MCLCTPPTRRAFLDSGLISDLSNMLARLFLEHPIERDFRARRFDEVAFLLKQMGRVLTIDCILLCMPNIC